ncbi:hypothetical protein KY317_03605 [Candidatus Woesearchaeota archaeon]|nr:hypothetical protein [Candidatus Woesearchaeota archaeon]
MFAIYGLVGLLLIILSYVFRINQGIQNPNLVFEIGYWLFFDALEFRLSGKSILHMVKQRKKFIFYAILIGALAGAVFDIFGVIISKQWSYPVVINFSEGVRLYLAWGIFLLMIYSSYRVFYILIKKLIGEFGKKLIKKSKERIMFKILGILGILIIIIPIIINLLFAFPKDVYVFGASIMGVWFVLEYVQYHHSKKTLIKDVVEGNWIPVFAIIIGALVTAIVWESMNLSVKAWTYKNFPFADIKILGIPIVIIIGWPALYIIFLSFFRALIKDRKIKIW